MPLMFIIRGSSVEFNYNIIKTILNVRTTPNKLKVGIEKVRRSAVHRSEPIFRVTSNSYFE